MAAARCLAAPSIEGVGCRPSWASIVCGPLGAACDARICCPTCAIFAVHGPAYANAALFISSIMTVATRRQLLLTEPGRLTARLSGGLGTSNAHITMAS